MHVESIIKVNLIHKTAPQFQRISKKFESSLPHPFAWGDGYRAGMAGPKISGLHAGANLTGDPFILLVPDGALDAAIAMSVVGSQIDRSSDTLGLP
jgi:hypothetical protein